MEKNQVINFPHYIYIHLDTYEFWLDILGFGIRIMSNKDNFYHNTNSGKKWVTSFYFSNIKMHKRITDVPADQGSLN